jgi:hypothetical protein
MALDNKKISPELIYLKGQTNIVADALSRLELATPKTLNEEMHDMHYLAANFGLEDDDLPENTYLLQYKLIATKGSLCQIEQTVRWVPSLILLWRRKRQHLICRNEKIVIPTTL